MTERVKYLVLSTVPVQSVGGIEQFVLESCRALEDAGCHVECISPSIYDGSARLVGRIWFQLKHIKRWMGEVSDAKQDVIVVHDPHLFRLIIPIVFVFPEIAHKCVLVTHGLYFHTPRFKRIKQWLSPLLISVTNHVPKVLCVGLSDYDAVLKYGNPKKVVLLGNGVNCPPDYTNRSCGQIRILWVGRDAEHKRLDLVLRLYEGLTKSNPEIRYKLTIVTPGLLKSGNAIMARELRVDVKYNISRKDLDELYCTSHFAVSASEYEGFGRTIVEAAAGGCIPIASSNPGHDFIKRRMPSILVRPWEGNYKEIIDDINRIASDEAEFNCISREVYEQSKVFCWTKIIGELSP